MKKIAVLLGLLLVAIGGCGSGNDGTLRVMLTDAPTDDLQSVYVVISDIQIHRSADTGDDPAGWIDLGPPDVAMPVDLLALQGVVENLIATQLTPGHYQQIRLHLASEGNYVVKNGEPLPLELYNDDSAVIKLHDNFYVYTGTTTNVLVDFDAEKSIVRKLSGYKLKPNVKVEVITWE